MVNVGFTEDISPHAHHQNEKNTEPKSGSVGDCAHKTIKCSTNERVKATDNKPHEATAPHEQMVKPVPTG